MGSNMSTELGNRCLFAENKAELLTIKQRVKDNDPTLTDIDLSNRFIGDTGINSNINCLIDNSHVTKIDLSYNQLTNESIVSLIKAMDQMPQLTHLSLSGNDIGAEGCKLLSEFLIEQRRRDDDEIKSTSGRSSIDKQHEEPIYLGLESLSLYHNNLYDKDVVPLVNAVFRNMTALNFLNLDQNHFTNATWVMFHRAICGVGDNDMNKNLFLTSIRVGLLPDLIPSEQLIDEIEHQLSQNRIEYEIRKYNQQMRTEAAARRREAAAIQEKLKREEDEDIRRQLQERTDELERIRLQEEEEMLQFERRMNAMKTARKTPQQIEDERKLWAERAVEQAYAWRNKITKNGTLYREWKEGFTNLVPRAGDSLGTKPTASIRECRKLQACWCDPSNDTAPYAKTLHYHCKHEDLNKSNEDGVVPHYDGCHATGHICASVGYYCKALPDLSAAHFFASRAHGDAPIDQSEYTYTS